MSVAYEFLDLYKQLEDLLEAKYAARNDVRRSSVIMEFLSSADGEPFRDRLNLCREIRNIMTHNADLDGEPVIMPSDAVTDSLKEIVEAVRQPQPAMDYATKVDTLLFAKYDDSALAIMKKMEERGFSHVPVLDKKGAIAGVFSVSTVFSSGLRAGRFSMSESTCIRDFEPLLAVDRHISEQFRFISAEATYPEAFATFKNRSRERKKRIAALFLTDNGLPSGRLLGMITPWDLIGRSNTQKRT